MLSTLTTVRNTRPSTCQKSMRVLSLKLIAIKSTWLIVLVLLLSEQLQPKKGIPLQDFIVRQDSLCGSTTGPLLASKSGIKTIDVGVP
jgi:hypothetical protein